MAEGLVRLASGPCPPFLAPDPLLLPRLELLGAAVAAPILAPAMHPPPLPLPTGVFALGTVKGAGADSLEPLPEAGGSTRLGLAACAGPLAAEGPVGAEGMSSSLSHSSIMSSPPPSSSLCAASACFGRQTAAWQDTMH